MLDDVCVLYYVLNQTQRKGCVGIERVDTKDTKAATQHFTNFPIIGIWNVCNKTNTLFN